MSAPLPWLSDVEVRPPGWHFPAGPSWLAGWINPPHGRLVTDLRAWIDGRPCLGLWGLPKPGLDEKFLGRPGPPYAGFVLQVRPHLGATLLRLEARDQAGDWHEFHRTPITVAAEADPCPPPPALAERLAALLPALLRRHALRPAHPLAAVADEVVSGALSEPLDSLPNPPFHGALEEPRATGRIRYGRLAVTGWLAHRTARIRRLTALADALQESPLLHGLPRADVGAVFADLPGRETAQFAGYVDLPSGLPAPVLLKVFAELEDGTRHLVFAQRFVPQVIAGADDPLPPLSRRLFARALWALRGSARRHGLPAGSGAALLAAARAGWQAWAAEAPPPAGDLPAAPAPPPAGPDRPFRALVVTHNLNFEGAPWFLLELARHHAAHGARVQVVSPQEGPMRAVFEAAGMPVTVLDLAPALGAREPAAFHRELARATAGLPWAETDLVIANTMVSFWAVHAAAHAGRPSLLYIHESAAIRRFFAPLVDPALFPVIEDAFRRATRVVFTAAASRAVFAYLGGGGNFALLPSWVDLAAIEAFAAAHPRADLRRKHGLDPAAVLLVNIGTVCERKGQHTFLRAVALLREELRLLHPDRRLRFVIVGARPGLYLDSLRHEVALDGLAEVVFVPETPEIQDFYRVADIFVCTSFEESFPRVILESAAHGLPIVSTAVHGVAEMLGPEDAWLVPPGDRYRLAEAMKAALAAHFAGDRTRADRARAAIAARYAAPRALPHHLALARAVLPR